MEGKQQKRSWIFVHDCFQSFLKDYNLLPPSTPAPPTGSKKGVVSLDSLSVTWHSESCARVVTLVYINIYIYILYIYIFIIFIYIYVSAMKWNFPGYASLLSAKDEKIMGSYRRERDGQWWHMWGWGWDRMSMDEHKDVKSVHLKNRRVQADCFLFVFFFFHVGSDRIDVGLW